MRARRTNSAQSSSSSASLSKSPFDPPTVGEQVAKQASMALAREQFLARINLGLRDPISVYIKDGFKLVFESRFNQAKEWFEARKEADLLVATCYAMSHFVCGIVYRNPQVISQSISIAVRPFSYSLRFFVVMFRRAVYGCV